VRARSRGAAAGRAQEPEPPADGPVVAGPLPNGRALVAFDRGGKLCFGIRGSGDSLHCGRPPDSALAPIVGSQWDGGPTVVFGVVTADVASVEVLAPGHRATVAAGAGDYAGRFTGRVRFFLAEVTGSPYRLRFFDAQGRAVGATDLGEAPALSAPVFIARGRLGDRAWRLDSFQRTGLAPTPLDLARSELLTCVDVRFGAAPGMTGGCARRSARPDAIAPFVTPLCQRDALVFMALAGGGIGRIDAVLGDGTRTRLQRAALPRSFRDPRRGFVLVVRGDVALRSLLVHAGARTFAVRLRIAPAQSTCGTLSLLSTYFFGRDPGGSASSTGPLVARDERDQLCVGLGTIAPSDCELPPAEPLFARIERRTAGGRTAVLVVVPAAVAAVRLHLDGGGVVTAPTGDLPGYDGRYRGLVRAVAATLPGARRLYDTDLLGADGRVLERRPGPDTPPLARAPRVLERLRGGVVVAARDRCVQIRPRGPTRDPAACESDPRSGIVVASCAARRIVVVVRTRRDLAVLTDARQAQPPPRCGFRRPRASAGTPRTHRSDRLSGMRRASMAVCLLVLLAPGAAHAQEDGPVPPANAAVVAGPLPDGTALVAFDRGDELRVAVARQRADCGPPPTVASQPRLQIGAHVSGVVTADVASVELLSTGARQTVPAGAGAYQGRFAGRVHFLLAASKGRLAPYRLRMLDAQGRAVGAIDFGDAPAVGPSAPVGHGRVGGTPWRAVAFQRTAVAPTPLDRGRTERITCLRFAIPGPRLPESTCSGRNRDPAGMSFSVTAECSASARVVSGLAGPAIGRIDAVLGDGARRPVALRALPARFDDPRRAYVVVVGRGIAVRALLVRERGRTSTLAVRAAPVDAECNQGGNFGVAFATFGVVLQPSPSGAGPIVARDDGDDLCVGLGTIVATDCQLPPADTFHDRIERRRAGTQTAVLAVVTAEVSALRLRVDHGAPLTVPTSDLPGYNGRYAGLVKAATVSLPGDRRLYSTDLLAADGHVLGSLPGPDQPPLAHTPRVVARLPGGVTVAASTECVQVRSGPPTRDRAACELVGLTDTFVVVPCAAHRAVIVSRVRRPATGLTAVTTAGRVRGRRHGALSVAILPPRAALREVRLTGAGRVGVHLPPAARQCGYTAFVTSPHR
jgi:hypothetical protein